MDFELSHEQRVVKAAVRRFVDREIMPVIGEYDRTETFPKEVFVRFGREGLLGGPIPIKYGGGGLDYIAYALLLEEIGRASSSFRSAVSVQVSLVALSILKWGTAEQIEKYLPRLCRGEMLGCFGLTESGAGSDAAGVRTRAVREGERWVLSGSKTFITNGGVADLALVIAQTDPLMGHRGLAAFLVERQESAFASMPITGKLGLRASDTAEIIFEGTDVPEKNLLGKVGEGFEVAMSALDQGRFSVAAGCVGTLEGCLKASVDYARQRKQFERPIGSFQLVQDMLARMKVDADAARFLVYRAALLKDKGIRDTLEVSIGKYFASEAAVRAANDAVQLFGASGYLDETPVARYYRDAKAATIYEGTSQIQKLIVGQDLTGFRAFAG
ncbi:MAG: acyl-CoA dehydrogenase family protein [Nitrospiria bacterium]